jgi:hypothetical protein
MRRGKTSILISLGVLLIFILTIGAFSFSAKNPQEKANELQFDNIVKKYLLFSKATRIS